MKTLIRDVRTLFSRDFITRVKTDLLVDRLQIEAMPAGAKRIRARFIAWGVILVIYCFGWGSSTFGAFSMLLNDGQFDQGTYTLGTFISNMMFSDVPTVFFALVAIIYFLPRALPPRPAWQTSLCTLPIYSALPYVVMEIAGGFAAVLGLATYDHPDRDHPSAASHLLHGIDSAMAGPTEELALLALPVIALRRVGHSWKTVLITAGILRVPFHMYYGWASVIFALWGMAAVLLYRRTCAIGAIVISHGLWNFLIRLNGVSDGISDLNFLIMALTLPVVIFYLERQFKRFRGEKSLVP